MSTDHDDFGGLARDLPLLLQRRNVLKMLAGGTLLALAACGSDSKSATNTAVVGKSTGTTGVTDATATTAGSVATSTEASTGTTAAASADTASAATCAPINEETAGPYPGDGSNGPNALTESGIVRSDSQRASVRPQQLRPACRPQSR